MVVFLRSYVGNKSCRFIAIFFKIQPPLSFSDIHFPSSPLLIFFLFRSLSPSLSLSLPISLSRLHYFCFGSLESCKTKARIFVLYDLKIENWVCANVEFRYFSTFNSPFVGGSRFNASSYLPADKVSIVTKIKKLLYGVCKQFMESTARVLSSTLNVSFSWYRQVFSKCIEGNYRGDWHIIDTNKWKWLLQFI